MTSFRQAKDPRLEALLGSDPSAPYDVRPQVTLPGSSLPIWAFVMAIALFAVLLFVLLESRRQPSQQPSVRPRSADVGSQAYQPPPLYVPPQPGFVPPPYPSDLGRSPVAAPLTIVQQPAPAVRVVPAPVQSGVAYNSSPIPQPQMPTAMPVRTAAGPMIVSDRERRGTGPGVVGEDNPVPTLSGPGGTFGPPRVRASALANRSGTVAQGSLLPAVLETAFDSTQAGFARALVSRDVRGFDGSRVLIPRGSRLIGDYQTQVSPGQNRANIIWSRIIRPDGITIQLNSPAVDPLGRGGIPASVNNHFFTRLGSALLRTTLDIGAAVAARTSRSPVLVAVPGTVQGQTSNPTTRELVPTLRVRAGKSISIFVARDLDFGTGQEGQ